MEFKEIETKYSAEKIKLKHFKDLCEGMGPSRTIHTSSYDYYFVKNDGTSIRYRSGDIPELTIKKKTLQSNNYIRTEVNLPLSPCLSEKERFSIVVAFCEMLGFTLNFTIHKTCEIYFYRGYNLVYYSVRNDELQEQGRFIEIEMDEKYAWKNEAQAWNKLIKIEKSLGILGLTSKSRISYSLFEMFKKDQRDAKTNKHDSLKSKALG